MRVVRLLPALLIFVLIPLKNFADVQQIPLLLKESRSLNEENGPSGGKRKLSESTPQAEENPISPMKGSQPRLKQERHMAAKPVESTEQPEEEPYELESQNSQESVCCEAQIDPCCEPDPRWYFEVKPGYFYFTDHLMRQFYNNGGFSFRAETGYKMWGPFYVWLDGGYFQREGRSLGIPASTKIKIATVTLGLKTIFYLHDRIALYAGAGPRVFMMMLHNSSPFVRGDDNEISVGAGFDAGFWVFPFPFSRNIFIDLFADYSLKKFKIEPDEISSDDFDVNVSGLTFGAGLGIRF